MAACREAVLVLRVAVHDRSENVGEQAGDADRPLVGQLAAPRSANARFFSAHPRDPIHQAEIRRAAEPTAQVADFAQRAAQLAAQYNNLFPAGVEQNRGSLLSESGTLFLALSVKRQESTERKNTERRRRWSTQVR